MHIYAFNHTFQGVVKQESDMRGSLARLWLTCRVIANENRLRLLWLIFTDPSLCVGDLAGEVGLAPAVASNQLRILCDEGLITAHRSGQQVRYRAGFQHAPAHVECLQSALEKSYKNSVPFPAIIHQATGFTHQRRIELMQRIAAAPASINELAVKTVMSSAALSRHLRKLEARHYIVLCNGRYTIGKPAGHLAKALSKTITG